MGKNIAIVVLVLLIIVAVVWAVKRTAVPPKGKAYYEAWNRPMKVMDVETKGEVEVKTGEWEQQLKVDKATGYRIDPKTGHKLAIRMQCFSCHKWIPSPPIPVDATPEQIEKIHREYKCPECGKPAMPPMEGAPPK